MSDRVPVRVRVARPADAEAVTALLEAAYPVLMAPDYAPDVLAAALPLMIRANPALLACGTYYLAETPAGEIVGCGGWTREHPGNGEAEPGLGHIRHFGTHLDWIGRGVARAVYRRCEADARAAGVTRFECCASLNAVGFYAAVGLGVVRELGVEMASGVMLPAVLMEKRL